MSRQITVRRLRLDSFKGIGKLTVEFGSGATVISGRNASGKTTVMDTFLWLLWGTNSEDQSTQKFGIKPQSADGTTLLDLNPEVEGEFAILDSDTGELQTLTLRKRWVGQWRTARGETVREFRGNKGEYFCNDVPLTEREYIAKVNDMIPMDVFKAMRVNAPIFIDNAESVNDFLPTDSQLVLLQVSDGDFKVDTGSHALRAGIA